MSIDTRISASMRDTHVVDRVLQGDVDAYRILVDRYRADAIAHAYIMCGDARLAETTVDTTFRASFHALFEDVHQIGFCPFYHRMLHHELTDLASSTQVPKMTPKDPGVVAGIIQNSPRGPAEAEVLRQALLAMPVNLREAWSLRYVVSLTEAEIVIITESDDVQVEERIESAKSWLMGVRPVVAPAPLILDDADITPPLLMPEM